MPDFPSVQYVAKPSVFIPSISFGSSFAAAGGITGLTYVDGVWPAANRALFLPFVINETTITQIIGAANGTVVNGNVDVGLYDAVGNRLVSSGSTAQAGTSAIQVYDIADTTLPPGHYYLAIASDSATARFLRMAANNVAQRATGCRQMAAAFPLPATATMVANASGYLPQISVLFRTLL